MIHEPHGLVWHWSSSISYMRLQLQMQILSCCHKGCDGGTSDRSWNSYEFSPWFTTYFSEVLPKEVYDHVKKKVYLMFVTMACLLPMPMTLSVVSIPGVAPTLQRDDGGGDGSQWNVIGTGSEGNRVHTSEAWLKAC